MFCLVPRVLWAHQFRPVQNCTHLPREHKLGECGVTMNPTLACSCPWCAPGSPTTLVGLASVSVVFGNTALVNHPCLKPDPSKGSPRCFRLLPSFPLSLFQWTNLPPTPVPCPSTILMVMSFLNARDSLWHLASPLSPSATLYVPWTGAFRYAEPARRKSASQEYVDVWAFFIRQPRLLLCLLKILLCAAVCKLWIPVSPKPFVLAKLVTRLFLLPIYCSAALRNVISSLVQKLTEPDLWQGSINEMRFHLV